MQIEIKNLIIQTIKIIKKDAIVDENSYIFGRSNALFDSIGLLELVVELEEAIYDKFGKNISLSDKKAMSQKTSPFININSLSRYIQKSLNE
ncbi:hypothetical protein V2I29_03395 [Campylobacter sp. CX2-8023-23]|uniref:hypothetical protein n=1 Tax=Campylobacter porcelli TaxID=1660073 RepID=UPI002EA0EB71|nr:hypothetical protein [Campylobacter sp. CX2-8023-23]